MIYEMYKVSENSRKLRYSRIIKLFDPNKIEEDESVSELKEFEDDSYFSESLKAPGNNKDTENEEIKEENQDNIKTESNSMKNLHKETKSAVATVARAVSKETGGDASGNDTQMNETENNDFETGRSQMNEDDLPEGENDDEYINDEEMIKIAETCLLRISNELKNQNLSIHDLYQGKIMSETIEDQTIELLAPIHFIEGIKKLGINDFTELDVACLVNLLTRQELDDLILVEELDILRDSSKLRELIAEMLEKSGTTPIDEDEDEEKDERPGSGEKKKKSMNFDKVSHQSICVIFLLTEYLLRNNMSLFTLYDGKIYDQ